MGMFKLQGCEKLRTICFVCYVWFGFVVLWLVVVLFCYAFFETGKFLFSYKCDGGVVSFV